MRAPARIPKIGEKIKFFDDGKAGFSRRYWAVVKEIYTPLQLVLHHPVIYFKWRSEKRTFPLLYNSKTDVFIFCEVKKYAYPTQIFVRTDDMQWFSIGYPNGDFCGELDVDDYHWGIIRDYAPNDVFLDADDPRNE